jgi:4-carboxymuconolactone decarboxylase
MSDAREKGRAAVNEMLGSQFLAGMEGVANSGGLGAGLAARALDDCYGHHWTDPRLDRRSRSLLTLGMVMALRADGEIKNHVRAALANGLTPVEIEAAIEHAVPYLGYPAAGNAFAKAMEVIANAKVDITFGTAESTPRG